MALWTKDLGQKTWDWLQDPHLLTLRSWVEPYYISESHLKDGGDTSLELNKNNWDNLCKNT